MQKSYSASVQHEKPEQSTSNIDYSRIVVGTKVMHQTFGEGTIIRVYKEGTKIEVAFAAGSKNFITDPNSPYNAFEKGNLEFAE